MKLWKKTVTLMLATLLCSLLLVGGLTLFVTGKRSLENEAKTYGRQIRLAAGLMEQFWDNGKYERMTEVGKGSYLEFQFRQCCGEGYALLDADGRKAIENLSGYEIVNIEALNWPKNAGEDTYRLQRLSGRWLMLQTQTLQRPEGCQLLSVKDITMVFTEIRNLAFWFLGIYGVIFLLAGVFIYRMMRGMVQSMEELQEVAGKQEMLLGALSHEMKTPLTSIVGYSDSLLHVKLGEEQKERALGHINREGRRLAALSGKMLQMLGLHRNEAVQMELHSMGELIQQTAELETEHALQKGILLCTEFEDFTLNMDWELMESLLLNLTENAIRASETGGRVILRAYQRENKKVLQVEDFGRGIPKEELKKVTEAFYMVDKSRSRREGGAGLGLALCVKIAELHHGRLSIDSREGKGTVVTVIFC